MSEKNLIGQKIRQFREARQLSVEELAEQCQNSPESIRRIEAGDLIPSLTPLMKIARALGVRLGTFLDDAPQTGPVVVRAGQSGNVVRFSGKAPSNEMSTLEFHSLASHKRDRHMEPFLIDVHPPQSPDCPLSSHEGEEFVYVLSGGIEVCYGKDRHILGPGDSIYYDSIVPHDLHASGGGAQILAIVYAPF